MRLGTLSLGQTGSGIGPLSAAEMAAQQGFVENTGGAPLYVAPYSAPNLTWGMQTPVWYQDPLTGQWVQVPYAEATAAEMSQNPAWFGGLNGLGMFTPPRRSIVPRYFGGVGDIVSLGDTAQCPSLEQLQGIVDINDPCQAAPLTTIPTMAGSVTPTPPSAMSGFTIGGVTISPWMVLGAVVVGLMVVGGSGGRR